MYQLENPWDGANRSFSLGTRRQELETTLGAETGDQQRRRRWTDGDRELLCLGEEEHLLLFTDKLSTRTDWFLYRLRFWISFEWGHFHLFHIFIRDILLSDIILFEKRKIFNRWDCYFSTSMYFGVKLSFGDLGTPARGKKSMYQAEIVPHSD